MQFNQHLEIDSFEMAIKKITLKVKKGEFNGGWDNGSDFWMK